MKSLFDGLLVKESDSNGHSMTYSSLVAGGQPRPASSVLDLCLACSSVSGAGEGGHTGRANDDELGAGPPPEEVRGPSIPLSVCGVSHPSEAAGE